MAGKTSYLDYIQAELLGDEDNGHFCSGCESLILEKLS